MGMSAVHDTYQRSTDYSALYWWWYYTKTTGSRPSAIVIPT